MKLRIAILLVIVGLMACDELTACLNIYGTDLHGHSSPDDITGEQPVERLRNLHIDREQWEAKAAELAPGQAKADYKHRSDYAVALIYLGRYDEAIAILEAVERQHPGEAYVAANLGTVYELSGNLPAALTWIQKGFERNADDHYGSEWLHIKILEAKLELADDPDWLKTHSVLGLDFGSGAAPRKPIAPLVDSAGESRDLSSVISAIEYQLHERLHFVTPPNPIVASLLFDLGNAITVTSVVEPAIQVYEYSREFGSQNPALLDQRIAHMKALAEENPLSGKQASDVILGRVAWAGGILLVLLLLLPVTAVLAYRRFRRSRTNQQV